MNPELGDWGRIASEPDSGSMFVDLSIRVPNIFDHEQKPSYAAPVSRFTKLLTQFFLHCSCDANCGQRANESCCFPKINGEIRSREECVFPGTKVPNKEQSHAFTFYLMVTERKDGGCKAPSSKDAIKENNALKQNSNSTTKFGNQTMNKSNDPEQNFWGNMIPVYSPTTGEIFKTAELADCYGVKDGIKWLAEIDCVNHKHWSMKNDLSFLINNAMNFDLYSSKCQVYFQPPPDIQDAIKSKRCFPDVIDTCRNNFDVVLPDGVNLTHGEVIAICESGLFSPFVYKKTYANLFCHLCNEKSVSNEQSCNTNDERTLLPRSFSSIIDPNYIQEMSGAVATQTDKTIRLACDLLQKNDCRIIYCPSGQIRDERPCIWPLGKVTGSAFSVLIKIQLSIPVPSDVYENDMFPFAIWKSAPWPEKWDLDGIFTEVSDKNATDTFLVLLAQKKSFYFKSLLKSIDQYTQRVWEIEIHNETILSRQTLVPYNAKMIYIPVFGKKIIENMSLPFDIPEYYTIFVKFNKKRTNPIYITQMFFCDQIELKREEYELFMLDAILYVKRSKKYMFQGQFSLIQTVNGKTPRICVSDSEFKDVSESTGYATSMKSETVLFYICILAFGFCFFHS